MTPARDSIRAWKQLVTLLYKVKTPDPQLSARCENIPQRLLLNAALKGYPWEMKDRFLPHLTEEEIKITLSSLLHNLSGTLGEGIVEHARCERRSLQPPKNAELIFSILFPREQQEYALGCFCELYVKRVARLGAKRAWLWAWCEVLKGLYPSLKRAGLRITGLAAAAEWLRQQLR